MKIHITVSLDPEALAAVKDHLDETLAVLTDSAGKHHNLSATHCMVTVNLNGGPITIVSRDNKPVELPPKKKKGFFGRG